MVSANSWPGPTERSWSVSPTISSAELSCVAFIAPTSSWRRPSMPRRRNRGDCRRCVCIRRSVGDRQFGPIEASRNPYFSSRLVRRGIAHTLPVVHFNHAVIGDCRPCRRPAIATVQDRCRSPYTSCRRHFRIEHGLETLVRILSISRLHRRAQLIEEAREAWREALRVNPNYSLEGARPIARRRRSRAEQRR